MEEEMESLRNNKTSDLVKLPNGRKLIRNRWVFKKKIDAAGQIEKYRNWLVEKGYPKSRESNLVRFYLMLLS